MEFKNLARYIFFMAASVCLVDSCCGMGYSPFCGGFTGGYGFNAYPSCSPYPCSPLASCLKAKLLKHYLQLKKPCLARPFLPLHLPIQRPCLPCLSCLAKQPLSCYKPSTCLKYPPCGPCPYANCGKCLKHKATLALCS